MIIVNYKLIFFKFIKLINFEVKILFLKPFELIFNNNFNI